MGALKHVEYLSLGMVARELGYSRRTVERWAQNGVIDCYKIAGRLLVEREYFERWKARKAVKKEIR